jgi:hypothetical protein
MDDRTKLTLLRGIRSGAFTDRQKLEAIRAIRSNADDQSVSDLVGSLAFSTLNKGKSLKELVDERQGIDRDAFDYKTGADSSLRALISFGETESDKESILKSIVGAGGYTRDAGGRLALTPKGQEERGMAPSDKNIVIEDEGFSFGDVADITGSIPEIAGSVVGGVLGAPLGLLGSAAGAGLGAAGAQAVEEGIETLLGVQTQTLGEVAKDVAIEGAIGAGADLVGGAIFAIGRGAARSATGAASRLGRPSIDTTEEQLARAEGLLGRGFTPSLELAGAPQFIAFQQKFLENVSKNTARIQNNTSTALARKADFLESVGADPLGELSEAIQFLAPGQLNKLRVIRDQNSKDALEAITDSVKVLRQGAEEGVDLNRAVLDEIRIAFDNFDKITRDKYAMVTETLKKVEVPVTLRNGRQIMKEGGTVKLFDTGALNSKLKDILERAGSRNLLDPVVDQAYSIVEDFGKMASFENLVNFRKFLTDNAYFNTGMSTKGAKEVTKLREMVDAMLGETNILDNIPGLLGRERMLMSKASEMLYKAHDDFRQGMKRFDELQKMNIIRSLKELEKEPQRFVDRFFEKVIKPDSPERLKVVLNATDNPEVIRDMLAKRYLDDALEASDVDFNNPNKFDGGTFYRQVKKLKGTGKELFGEDWDRVQRLARAVSFNGQRKIDREILDQVIAQDPGADIVTTLTRLNEAQVNLDEALSAKVARDIDAGVLTPEDAARKIVSPSTTDSETVRILRSFQDTPEIKEKIRAYVLDDILQSVTVDVFSNKANANSLKEVVDSYKPGVLKRILGEDTFSGLRQFADDLATLSDLSKEGSIAAAGITSRIFSHPVNTLLQMGRFRFLSRMFSDPETVRRYIKLRRQLEASPEGRGEAIISMMNEVAAEQGVDAAKMAEKARRAVQNLDVGARVARQSAARPVVESFGPDERSVPRVQPPEAFSFANMFEPAQPMAQTSRRPLSPIEGIRQSAIEKSLRQRATENPAIAASLLGGLGSAALLNR